MCALLIDGQYVFSFVVGVEIVTVLLISFACAFGVRRGIICAVAFSLLRCLLYGFYPTVIILYLIYYPLLAAVFGGLGHIKDITFKNYPIWFAVIINAVLLSIATACALSAALGFIKISRLWESTVTILLWVIFGLCLTMLFAFDGLLIAAAIFKKNTAAALKIITFASIAAVCTAVFTLLDDIITPLIFGYSRLTALAYFYSSFTAMLPQVICTIITVCTLFAPLSAAIERAAKI